MMRRVDEYMEANRANWDQRAPAHAMSPGYNVQRFIDDPAFIGEVVRFDRPLLGDVSGLTSISRWAATVAALLKPGGRLFIRTERPWRLAASYTLQAVKLP